MNNISIVIVEYEQETSVGSGHGAGPTEQAFGFRARKTSAAKDLESAWPEVATFLSGIVDKSAAAFRTSPFALDEIEVHLAVETGVKIGFVAKANAELTLTFKRKEIKQCTDTQTNAS